MILLQYTRFDDPSVFDSNQSFEYEKNCGTGAGGFKPGNSCAKGGYDGPKNGSDISNIEDLQKFAEHTQHHSLYTHAFRYGADLESAVNGGIQAGKNGVVSSTSTMVNSGGQIDNFKVRDIGSGYVVFDGSGLKKRDKEDIVSVSEKYAEVEFLESIPRDRIVKTVRMITDSTGHRIREDYLAQYALKNQGLDNHETQSLDEIHKKWFHFSI